MVKKNKPAVTRKTKQSTQMPEQPRVTIAQPKPTPADKRNGIDFLSNFFKKVFGDLQTNKTDSRTGIEFICIPAGNFLYGNSKERKHLPEYEIAKYPVTVAQFREYCNETGKSMPEKPSWGWIDNHPMVNVRWHDAKAFSDYYGYRLPTEEEWEKAARGTDGREYPWGNDWDKNKCVNYDNSKSTQPVGEYLNGVSPYGCMDMAGNVWEWMDSWYDNLQKSRVLRGGSWSRNSAGSYVFRCACRGSSDPVNQYYYRGFRVAR